MTFKEVSAINNIPDNLMISRGAEWHRWEPHIHAPGTIMNNQFCGQNAWENYLSALEQAIPVIEAITITSLIPMRCFSNIKMLVDCLASS